MPKTMQRYLSNHRNILAGAVASLTTGTTKGSRAVFLETQRKSGSGTIEIVGDYTQLADDTLSVQIAADPNNQNEQISQPDFVGVGNGDLLDVVVGGSLQSGQEFTITMVDEGTVDTKASTPAFGVIIRAKAVGTAGNNIAITVGRGPTRIIRTTSDLSTVRDLSEGATDLGGQEIDFGGPFIQGGVLPLPVAFTPVRVSFKGHPFVYWTYRDIVEGTVRNFITPPLKADIPSGTVVQTISGKYDVRITDGVTTESYLVVTEFDLLTKISQQSQLVEVVGAIVQDMTPGSMGTNEINIYTGPYPSDVTFQGSEFLTGFSSGPTIVEGAPTENVVIECIHNGHVGSEQWRVTAAVSNQTAIDNGAVDSQFIARTNVPYTHPTGNFGFTIPVKTTGTLLDESELFRLVDVKYEDRTESAQIPDICVEPLALGGQAESKRIVFTYRKRPALTCPCDDVEYQGALDPDCLGLPPGSLGPETGIGTWIDAFITSNSVSSTVDVVSPSYKLWLVNKKRGDGLPAAAPTEITMADLNRYRQDFAILGSFPYVGNLNFCTPSTCDNVQTQGQGFNPNLNISSFSSNMPSLSLIDDLVAATTGIDHYAVEDQSIVTEEEVLVYSGTIPEVWLEQCRTLFVTAISNVKHNNEALQLVLDAIELFKGDVIGLDEQGPNGPDVNPSTGQIYTSVLNALKAVYQAAIDAALILAGVAPTPPGDDGCWVDQEGEEFWWVPDDGNMPAFTNWLYVSSRKRNDGSITSTQEYALVVKVGCPHLLVEGDQFVVEITPDGLIRTYQVGDRMLFTTIRAAPLPFQGGIDGNDELTWSVEGDKDGTFDQYVLTAMEEPYSEGGLSFRIIRGVIPFEVGDSFSFTTEALLWRYRFGSGAWSAFAPLEFKQTALSSSGLSVLFQGGNAPSFGAGDFQVYTVEQKNAVDHLYNPDAQIFQWDGAEVTAQFVLTGSLQLDAVALGFVDLPTGAAVTIEGSDDGGSTWTVFTEALTVRNVVMCHFFDETKTVDALRIVITGATGGSIGWFWAGDSFSTSITAQVEAVRRKAIMSNPVVGTVARRFAAKTFGGSLEYSSFLVDADVDELESTFEYSKENGNWPLIFAPNIAVSDRAILGSFTQDELELSDLFWFQTGDETGQRISTSFDFEGVASE